jgi:phosphatidylserine/phosphatidylglycerophosphate/cardiolipin synthase-like enzyme
MVFTHLMNALGRGVKVTIVTHDVLNAASVNAAAVEELRREAQRVRGTLTVFSAELGGDRHEHPLLHAKLFVADESRVLLGSANLTSYALTTNLELGTLLGRDAAVKVASVILYLIQSGTAYLVFSTGGNGGQS